jgi:hypothetical protein
VEPRKEEEEEEEEERISLAKIISSTRYEQAPA